ncbi:MAG: cyclic nucleotide-binding domain-containing protein [Anaerolineaceae bacterium]|nr:cyclic nucleotide-binding domain-containing protein [Anaerolineaceae bacterium]
MLNQADITTSIKSIPWFLELSPESIHRLTSVADVRAYETGDVLFTEGEQNPYLYVILEGKIQLESYVPGHGSLPTLTAESLDIVGWSSLTPVVRQKTSTARVVEPATLLAFDAETLMEFCEKDCELGFVIMRRLANVVASRLLTQRLFLLELISSQHDSQS